MIKHLKWIDEGYFEHMWFAFKVAGVLIVHGLMPWVWQFKATEMMQKKELQRQEKIRRGRSGYEQKLLDKFSYTLYNIYIEQENT